MGIYQAIKCNSELNLSKKKRDSIKKVARELTHIKRKNKLDCIVIRGGFVVDCLLGINPRDIDIFYSYKNSRGNYSKRCKCKTLKASINSSDLEIRNYSIDLENSFEKSPPLDPIEQTVGAFSRHNDFVSKFCLDEKGNVWGNKMSIAHFKKRIYEIDYRGWLMWPYFEHTGNPNYYLSHANSVIRGFRYIVTKGMRAGPNYIEMVNQSPYVLSELMKDKKALRRFQKYYSDSNLEMKNIEKEIKKMVGVNNKVIKVIREALGN